MQEGFLQPCNRKHLPQLSYQVIRLGRSLQFFSPSRTLQRCPKKVTVITQNHANAQRDGKRQSPTRHRRIFPNTHPRCKKASYNHATAKHLPQLSYQVIRLGRSLQFFSTSRTLQRCPKKVTVITQNHANARRDRKRQSQTRHQRRFHNTQPRCKKASDNHATAKHLPQLSYQVIRLGRSLQFFSPSRTLQRCPKKVTVITQNHANARRDRKGQSRTRHQRIFPNTQPRCKKASDNHATAKHLPQLSYQVIRLGRSLQFFSPSRTLQRCPKKVTVITQNHANARRDRKRQSRTRHQRIFPNTQPRCKKASDNHATAKHLPQLSYQVIRLGRSLQFFSPSRTLQRCPKKVTVITQNHANPRRDRKRQSRTRHQRIFPNTQPRCKKASDNHATANTCRS